MHQKQKPRRRGVPECCKVLYAALRRPMKPIPARPESSSHAAFHIIMRTFVALVSAALGNQISTGLAEDQVRAYIRKALPQSLIVSIRHGVAHQIDRRRAPTTQEDSEKPFRGKTVMKLILACNRKMLLSAMAALATTSALITSPTAESRVTSAKCWSSGSGIRLHKVCVKPSRKHIIRIAGWAAASFWTGKVMRSAALAVRTGTIAVPLRVHGERPPSRIRRAVLRLLLERRRMGN